ncbi:MAG: T9SS type A sorting domain-containing protein [candidate division WOR-3 bacterium]
MKKIIGFSLFIFSSLLWAQKKDNWCGTLFALERFLAKSPLQRPDLSPESIIETEHFLIHYTLYGQNRSDPTYAQAVASYFEYSWHKQMDTMGWAAPPPDYGQGGDDRYDVYIYDLPSGVGGWCVTEAWYSEPYPNGATSWIGIDNGLGLGNFLKVACAHEFSHASQFRYSAQEMNFIYENTAVWMEDCCYEEINDYVGYLSTSPNPLGNPDYPITSVQNLYLYAGGIWFMFLEDRYDITCPRRVWERMGEVAGENTLSAIDSVLREYYSSNLREALKDYALWRYFVGMRADTTHFFKEGNLWPTSYLLRTITEYPTWGTEDPRPPFAPGGCDFIQLQNGGGKLLLNFNGEDGYKWRLWVIGYKSGNHFIFEMRLDSLTNVGRDSFNWGDRAHFALIPVVCDWEFHSGALIFDYDVDCRILRDVGVASLVGIPGSVDTGSFFIPKAWVKNYGRQSETFDAIFRVGDFYTNQRRLTLSPNDSFLQEFSPCTLRARGYQNYICTLALEGDERVANNFRTGRILVLVRDVGVLEILEPVGTVPQGRVIQPKAKVKNFGNLPVQFDCHFWINSWRTTKRVNLAAGREFDLTFDSTWLANDTGQFTVRCSTAYADDKNPFNDKVEGSFSVSPSGIGEGKGKRIIFDKEKMEVYNALGIKVYEGEKISLFQLPSGIYFLNPLSDKKARKKVLIVR